MKLQEARIEAQKGIKVTHINFTPNEYMTMKHETIIFEDGVTVNFNSWVEDKPWLEDGWSIYE